MKLFCFGFGYVASNFAKFLSWDDVCGTHRADFPLNDELRQKLAAATHILHSIPPNANVSFDYKMNPQWFGYLSTTGVYGNTDGGWVDEIAPTNPNNERSAQRVAAEKYWLNSGLPVNVFRLAGIYGSGRSAIDELQNGTAKRIIKENQYFSRINVEDICQILAKSFGFQGEVFNCADDFPSSAAEVVEYAANLMGVAPPPAVPYETANLSEMARSFYASSRRVSNAKTKEMLGAELKYPNYKSWYDSCFN